MSLRLCYRLTLPGDTSVDDVRARLQSLKDFADTVGFERVFPLTEYTPDELADADDKEIVKIIVSTLCADPPDFYGAGYGSPCVMAMAIAPGDECEPAILGFIAPGARSDIGGPDDDLHPGEWFWSGACQTQYASRISDEHFLRCHIGLVRVLDHAAAIGITVGVEDETGYWDDRSDATLLKISRDVNQPLQFAEEDYRRWLDRPQADGADSEAHS